MNNNGISNYKRGLLIFVIISLITLFLLFLSGDISLLTLKKGIKNFNPLYLPILCLLMVIHILVDCIRLKVIAWGINTKLSLKTGWNAYLANEFLSAVTPFQSGGQPIEIYILHKSGISLGKSVVISYFKTATSLLFLLLTGCYAIISYEPLSNFGHLTFFYIYGGGFIIYFIIISYLSVFKPSFAKKLSFIGMKFLKRIRIVKKDSFNSRLKFILKEVNNFNHYIKNYFLTKKLNILLTLIITFISWTTKYLIAYFIAIGMGIKLAILDLLLFQSAIHFVNYSIPTPGASGTSELVAHSIFKFLSPVFASGVILNLFVTLWRFFTYHILIIVSGLATFKIIKDRLKVKNHSIETKNEIIYNSNVSK